MRNGSSFGGARGPAAVSFIREALGISAHNGGFSKKSARNAVSEMQSGNAADHRLGFDGHLCLSQLQHHGPAKNGARTVPEDAGRRVLVGDYALVCRQLLHGLTSTSWKSDEAAPGRAAEGAWLEGKGSPPKAGREILTAAGRR